MSYLSPYPFYLLRTPSMPVDSLLNLHDSVNFEDTLKKVFATDEMKEAIYTASPELFMVMLDWFDGKLKDEKQKEKLFQSLHKYYARMSSRSTPYGLFAGCTIGDISEEASEINFEDKAIKKHSRLDMNYVGELTNHFNRIPEIANQLNFYPNDTLYKVGKRYRYAEYSLRNKKRSYQLTSLSESIYLEIILENAKSGAKISSLKNKLVEEGVEEEQAKIFVNKLISVQVLVSDLYPTVTGDEYFKVLTSQLRELKGTEAIIEQLNQVKMILAKQDSGIDKYSELKKIVQGFIPTESKDLVQTDLFYEPVANVLNKKIVDEIINQIESIYKIGSVIRNPNLDDFKKKFSARYEDKEVPLFIALDAEVGIGYGLNVSGNAENMPLLGDLSVPGRSQDQSFAWNSDGKKIYQKLKKFIDEKQAVIEITDEDLGDISEKENRDNIPPSIYLMGSLMSNSAKELDEGNYQFLLSGLGGPSAGNLLARFCHGSPKLTELVSTCLDDEKESYGDNVILAEVVHLPESRVGNVLMRPKFRQYEIPFLGKSSVSEEYQIPVNDLMISVRNDRIIIRSKRLDKEIIPRLTNAHNFTRGLSVYRMLCDLQFQGVAGIYFWNWSVFSEETYLPRIEYKKLILQRARWHFKKKDFPQLQEKKEDFVPFFKELQQRYNIPRLIVIHEGDNELLIDFDSNESIKILIDTLRKKDVELFEYLFKPEQCFIKDKDGGFANEIIIPLKSSVSRTNIPLYAQYKAETTSLLKRSFITGSEWLYVKIYAGSKNIDTLLTEVMKPMTEELIANKVIEKWFFIRYYDPEGHLRIRFHNRSNPDFWMIVLKILNEKLQPFLENGLISKVSTETYNREIERYGVATMDVSEDLFCADSTAVVNFIDLIEGDEGERYRWLFSLRNIDMLLDDFDYSIEQKFELLSHLQASFYSEFSRESKTNKLLYSLNDKYRAESKNIAQILNPAKDTEDIADAIACYGRRSEYNRKLASQLREINLINAVDAESIDDLLPSYIHMTLNRTFLARQRMHELVIYHYLMKYYESQLARKRAEEKKKGVFMSN